MFDAWDIAAAVTSINTDLAPLFSNSLLIVLVLMLAAWGSKQMRKFGINTNG